MIDIVNAVFFNSDGVLLARRSQHRKNYPDLWSFPGGHVENGENLDDALVREIAEELAVVPLVFERFMQISDPNTTAEPITYHMYLIRNWKGSPQIVDAEHSELRWFSIAEARQINNLALKEYISLFDQISLLNI